MTAPSEGVDPTDLRSLRAKRSPRGWLVRIILLVVAALATVVIVRLVGAVAWDEVWDAFSFLDWWQPVVLVGLLLLRQIVNALPLALYIPGVSAFRATANDVSAALMTLVAPPPSDVAVRLAMFSSWGVPSAKALAGIVLNTLTFYVVRFSAPLIGFVMVAIMGRPVGVRWLDLISLAIAISVLGVVMLVVRSDQLAETIGREGGRLIQHVRKKVDPEAWARACQTFRGDIEGRFRRGFPRGLAATLGMLAVDLTMLVCCLRFVGISPAEVSVAEIAVAYLFAFPLTLFPFSGLGIVDALILAAIVEAGGPAVEAAGIAGLMVWRVFTIAGPGILGVLALVWWRGTIRKKPADTEPASA